MPKPTLNNSSPLKRKPLNNPSLKSKLLVQLAVPLLFFMLIESVLSYFVTLHYVNNTYDGWLLDSARSLAQEIKLKNAAVVVELPPAALEIFKWDEQDKTYFKVISEQNQLVAGDIKVPDPRLLQEGAFIYNAGQQLREILATLNLTALIKPLNAPTLDWAAPIYFNSKLYGEAVRVVSMQITPKHTQAKFIVSVAETENKRRHTMLDILVADLAPQILLLLLVGIYLFTGVRRGLQPLHHLADEIAKRSPRDLQAIPDTEIVVEAHALVHTINDLFGRLRLAIATQERFISNAAHQLRTPLAGLKLQAERALREQDLNAMRPALVHIQNSADRLSHLVSQLLVLAKTEPNQHNYELRPLELCGFARQICIEWVPKALEQNIELNFDSPDTDIMILADSLLLKELMVNVLDNAIAYGVEQGNVWVQVNGDPLPQLIIKDDGPGIPTTEIDRAVERFYRIPGSVGNGCGLGLAIVKEIADLHHAQLNIRSLQPGLEIRLSFPAVT